MAKTAQLIGGQSNKYGRAAADFYPTPPETTLALLDFLGIKPGTRVWEPAAGDGDMADVMTTAGLKVVSTDIRTGDDFLKTEETPGDIQWIITNPPFCESAAFIEHAATFGVPFAYLLKSQYWHAARRIELFDRHPPTYILPLTWRPDFLFKSEDRQRGSSLMDVCWTVWMPYNKTFPQYIPLKRP